MAYSIIERGASNSKDYRIFFTGPKPWEGVVSPFHDIPLYADQKNETFNMIVEAPRWSNAKMEIDTKSLMNPIKQDVEKGKLRFVKNCFPHHGYIWNYGALPQTWEDPTQADEHTQQFGDNGLLDVCEIGQKVHKRGAVIEVKVLGIMALIVGGETDWKVLAIDVTDPLAKELNDVNDIDNAMPGFLRATHEWFRIYEIPDGKGENKLAFRGEAKGKEFCLNIIEQMHQQWRRLVGRRAQANELSCENTAIISSPYLISAQDARAALSATAKYSEGSGLDSDVDTWHYVRL